MIATIQKPGGVSSAPGTDKEVWTLPEDILPSKPCSKCGINKPLSEFYSQSSAKDGKASDCKVCRCAAQKRRRDANPEYMKEWRKNNPDKVQANRQSWYEANPEKRLKSKKLYRERYPERVLAQHRHWSARNRNKIRETRRLRAEGNREALNEYFRRYRAENYAAVKANEHNSRLRRRQTEGTFTEDDVAQMFLDQDGLCAYCEEPLEGYHIDHIVPVIAGGSNWPDNLALSCGPCNWSKKDRPVEVFMQQRMEGSKV